MLNVAKAYQLILGRDLSPDELQRLQRILEAFEIDHEQALMPFAAFTHANALLMRATAFSLGNKLLSLEAEACALSGKLDTIDCYLYERANKAITTLVTQYAEGTPVKGTSKHSPSSQKEPDIWRAFAYAGGLILAFVMGTSVFTIWAAGRASANDMFSWLGYGLAPAITALVLIFYTIDSDASNKLSKYMRWLGCFIIMALLITFVWNVPQFHGCAK